MDKIGLDLEIQEIMSALDDARLQALVSNLAATEIQRYKKELTNAWLLLFEMHYYGHLSDRPTFGDDPDAFFTHLMHLLAGAEKINTPTIYHEERSRCYQELARLTTTQEKKLLCIETAAEEISQALANEPSSSKLNSRMIDIFLDRARIRNQLQLTDGEFAELLGYFDRVLTQFSEEWTSLLGNSLRILDFISPQDLHWYTAFVDKLSVAIQAFAEANRPAYLEWAKGRQKLINFWIAVTSEEYKSDLVRQLAKLLAIKSAKP